MWKILIINLHSNFENNINKNQSLLLENSTECLFRVFELSVIHKNYRNEITSFFFDLD